MRIAKAGEHRPTRDVKHLPGIGSAQHTDVSDHAVIDPHIGDRPVQTKPGVPQEQIKHATDVTVQQCISAKGIQGTEDDPQEDKVLEQSRYRLEDHAEVTAVVRDHPWATLLSPGDDYPVASYLPVLPDPDGDGTVVLGHLARSDAHQHRLGELPVLLAFQGPHGYVSPSWYGVAPQVPTWNFVVVHLYGRPEVLDSDETLAVLRATAERFEARLGSDWRFEDVGDYARQIAPATTGFRLRPDRVVAKAKLSQDKPTDVVRRVVHALEKESPYANPELADVMRRLVPGVSSCPVSPC